ncbi:MAG: hypothetical protein JXA20_13940 [Spirochaetes bacterium]|nr:hypothetical protein [Spirochaetota bacterium]
MKKTVIALVVLLCAGSAVFMASRYLLIFTKDSVVDQQGYLGNRTNDAGIYSSPPTGLLYSPISIDVPSMDSLMLLDVDDDPEYASIELQTFDDARGRGARVILYRHRGPADSYYTDRRFVIRGTAHDTFYLAPDMAYRLEVTPSGLEASLRMKDRRGTPVELRIREAPRRKWSRGFLAPIGASGAIAFDYFPFFFMKGMNFVSRSGSEMAVRIGGEERRPKKLPIPVDWKFVYLSRYTAAPIIGRWNAPREGILRPLRPRDRQVVRDGDTEYGLVNNAGHHEIRRVVGRNDRHSVSFLFSPPIPDLPCLRNGIELEGRFCAGADDTPGIIAGVYRVVRRGDAAEMKIRPLEGWQPMPGPVWVRRWRWTGRMTVGENGTVSMKSEWIREQ